MKESELIVISSEPQRRDLGPSRRYRQTLRFSTNIFNSFRFGMNTSKNVGGTWAKLKYHKAILVQRQYVEAFLG